MYFLIFRLLRSEARQWSQINFPGSVLFNLLFGHLMHSPCSDLTFFLSW